MSFGTRFAAQTAQVIGQALTGWALLALWVQADSGLVLWTLMLVIAIALPVRTRGTDRDRAVSNFGSGLVLWSLIAIPIFWSLLEKVMFGDPGFPLSTEYTLMLVATVMFMFAGGFFWLLGREEEG